MPDVVDKATRSRMMAAIKGKNTRPEILVRKALHATGFRFRLHDRKLPGRPDIVLKKYRAVVFVQGCFWHGHECKDFRWPKTRKAWWRKKIEGNSARDTKNVLALRSGNWRVLTIWECALPNNRDVFPVTLKNKIALWIGGKKVSLEIGGGTHD